MNKDLDERLVPNGEYRDALNIEVSTAEDAEIGTARNLPGNMSIGGVKVQEPFWNELAQNSNTTIPIAVNTNTVTPTQIQNAFVALDWDDDSAKAQTVYDLYKNFQFYNPNQGAFNGSTFHEQCETVGAVVDNQTDKIYQFLANALFTDAEAAVGGVVANQNVASNSTTITIILDSANADIAVGQHVANGTNASSIAYGTTVAAISGTTLTLSKTPNSTVAAADRLTFSNAVLVGARADAIVEIEPENSTTIANVQTDKMQAVFVDVHTVRRAPLAKFEHGQEVPIGQKFTDIEVTTTNAPGTAVTSSSNMNYANGMEIGMEVKALLPDGTNIWETALNPSGVALSNTPLGKVHIEDITFSSNVVGGVSTPKITIRLDKPCEITQQNITDGVVLEFSKEKLLDFVTGDKYEYTQTDCSGTETIIDNPTPGTNKIHSIDIVDGIIYYTDGRTEPKRIDIAKGKWGSNYATQTPIQGVGQQFTVSYGPNFYYTTKMIYNANISEEFGSADQKYGLLKQNKIRPYVLEDITVIRRAPKNPPKLEMKRSKRIGPTHAIGLQAKTAGVPFVYLDPLQAILGEDQYGEGRHFSEWKRNSPAIPTSAVPNTTKAVDPNNTTNPTDTYNASGFSNTGPSMNGTTPAGQTAPDNSFEPSGNGDFIGALSRGSEIVPFNVTSNTNFRYKPRTVRLQVRRNINNELLYPGFYPHATEKDNDVRNHSWRRGDKLKLWSFPAASNPQRYGGVTSNENDAGTGSNTSSRWCVVQIVNVHHSGPLDGNDSTAGTGNGIVTAGTLTTGASAGQSQITMNGVNRLIEKGQKVLCVDAAGAADDNIDYDTYVFGVDHSTGNTIVSLSKNIKTALVSGDVINFSVKPVRTFNRGTSTQNGAPFVEKVDWSHVVAVDVQLIEKSKSLNNSQNYGAKDGVEYWHADLVESEEPMYRKKFPRIATRYRYDDGQKSAFSPFSMPAFLPKTRIMFDAESGTEKAMENDIRDLRIKDFIDPETPHDVEAIDIVCKFDGIENIYLLKTIKKNSNAWKDDDGKYLKTIFGENPAGHPMHPNRVGPVSANLPGFGSVNSAPFTHTSFPNKSYGNTRGLFRLVGEKFGSTIPSDQILRPFDNVPRKAKTQCISANRIIYSNYTQNYDLVDKNGNDVKPRFVIGWRKETSRLFNGAKTQAYKHFGNNQEYGMPNPSVKSGRTYTLGVVYLDRFGRQSPVVLAPESTFTTPFHEAHLSKKLSVSFDTNVYGNFPHWATDYRFYIKETSNEYYNVTAYKFYPVKTSATQVTEYYVAFHSEDRNKIQEDTFLYLKHGRGSGIKILGQDNNISDYEPYKVLEISNEIPTVLNPEYNSSATNNVPERVPVPSMNGITDTRDKFYVKLKADGKLLKALTFNPVEESIDFSVSPPLAHTVGIAYDGVVFETKPDKDLDLDIFYEIPRTYPVELNEDNIESHINVGDRIYGYRTGYNSDVADLTQPTFSHGAVTVNNGHGTGSIPSTTMKLYESKQKGYFEDLYAVVKNIKGSSKKGGVQQIQLDRVINFGVPNLPFPLASYNGTAVPVSKGYLAGTFFTQYSNTDQGYYLDTVSPAGFVPDNYAGNFNTTSPVLNLTGSFAKFGSLHVVRPDGSKSTIQIFNGNDERPGLGRIGMQFATSTGLITEVQLNNGLNTGSAQVCEIENRQNQSYINTDTIEVVSECVSAEHLLPWYNCWSYGNGVESDRVLDDFNAPRLDNGVRASTFSTDYKEEERKHGMIFSGLYNSKTGVNNLNQFITAKGITKDLNPEYGSIQKTFTRNTDILAFCENKVLKVLSNKDALFNADGNTNVTSTKMVLGQAIPFAGDHGISRNPESFASDEYRCYFADRDRGSVCRLSRDGITVISDIGMHDYFADELKSAIGLYGGFNDRKGEYDLTIHNRLGEDDTDADNTVDVTKRVTTVSFNEKTNSWVSFRSYIPEFSVSLNNQYYTFKQGDMFLHADFGLTLPYSEITRNHFYGVQYCSTITPVFNDAPAVIKSFKTMSYEGTQAKVLANHRTGTTTGTTSNSTSVTLSASVTGLTVGQMVTSTDSSFDQTPQANPVTVTAINAAGTGLTLSQALSIGSGVTLVFSDQEYYNDDAYNGWHVESIITDQQTGEVLEFREKEGKWFNNIIGEATTFTNDIGGGNATGNVDSHEFSVQGLGPAAGGVSSSGTNVGLFITSTVTSSSSVTNATVTPNVQSNIQSGSNFSSSPGTQSFTVNPTSGNSVTAITLGTLPTGVASANTSISGGVATITVTYSSATYTANQSFNVPISSVSTTPATAKYNLRLEFTPFDNYTGNLGFTPYTFTNPVVPSSFTPGAIFLANGPNITTSLLGGSTVRAFNISGLVPIGQEVEVCSFFVDATPGHFIPAVGSSLTGGTTLADAWIKSLFLPTVVADPPFQTTGQSYNILQQFGGLPMTNAFSPLYPYPYGITTADGSIYKIFWEETAFDSAGNCIQGKVVIKHTCPAVGINASENVMKWVYENAFWSNYTMLSTPQNNFPSGSSIRTEDPSVDETLTSLTRHNVSVDIVHKADNGTDAGSGVTVVKHQQTVPSGTNLQDLNARVLMIPDEGFTFVEDDIVKVANVDDPTLVNGKAIYNDGDTGFDGGAKVSQIICSNMAKTLGVQFDFAFNSFTIEDDVTIEINVDGTSNSTAAVGTSSVKVTAMGTPLITNTSVMKASFDGSDPTGNTKDFIEMAATSSKYAITTNVANNNFQTGRDSFPQSTFEVNGTDLGTSEETIFTVSMQTAQGFRFAHAGNLPGGTAAGFVGSADFLNKEKEHLASVNSQTRGNYDFEFAFATAGSGGTTQETITLTCKYTGTSENETANMILFGSTTASLLTAAHDHSF